MTSNDRIKQYKDITANSKRNNIEAIFNWHNGLVLERMLNFLSKSNYKYDKCKQENLTFMSDNDTITIDRFGNIIEGENVPKDFEKLAIIRLSKTQKMLEMF